MCVESAGMCTLATGRRPKYGLQVVATAFAGGPGDIGTRSFDQRSDDLLFVVGHDRDEAGLLAVLIEEGNYPAAARKGIRCLVQERTFYGQDQAINAIPIASSQTDHAM